MVKDTFPRHCERFEEPRGNLKRHDRNFSTGPKAGIQFFSPLFYIEDVITLERRFRLSGSRYALTWGMDAAWAGLCRWHRLSGSEGHIYLRAGPSIKLPNEQLCWASANDVVYPPY